jgi:hypothetical protein
MQNSVAHKVDALSLGLAGGGDGAPIPSHGACPRHQIGSWLVSVKELGGPDLADPDVVGYNGVAIKFAQFLVARCGLWEAGRNQAPGRRIRSMANWWTRSVL